MPPKPPPPNRNAGPPSIPGPAPPTHRPVAKAPPSTPPPPAAQQRQKAPSAATSPPSGAPSNAAAPQPPRPPTPPAPTPRSEAALGGSVAASEGSQRPPPPRSRPPSVPATPAAGGDADEQPQRTPAQAASAPVTPSSTQRGPAPTWKPVGRKASVAQPPKSRPESTHGTPSRSTTPITRSAGPSDTGADSGNAPRSMPPETHTEVSHSHDEYQQHQEHESQYGAPTSSEQNRHPLHSEGESGEASVTRGSPSFIRRKTGAPPPRPRSFSRGSRRQAPPSPPPAGSSGYEEPLIAAGSSGSHGHHLISLDDKPSVVPRTRSARYVTPHVSRNIGRELGDTSAFGEMLELQTEDTTREIVAADPVRWENSASRVFVFQQQQQQGGNRSAGAATGDASSRHEHSRSSVHNPPSPPRRSKYAGVPSTGAVDEIEAPRSTVVPLLSYRVVSALRRIYAAIVESAYTAHVCDLLGAVTLVLSEVARFDKDFDLTEPLTLCFVNPQSMLVAAHAFRLLADAGFDAFADATVLAMRARQRARRNLSSLPTAASLAPVLDMTMPEIAARIELLLPLVAPAHFNADADHNSTTHGDHKAAVVARVFVTDSIVALLEGQATVDDAWAAYATATSGTGSTPLKAHSKGTGLNSKASTPSAPQIMRFIDVERFVRQSPCFYAVEPRQVADALSAFASLEGQGALQFYEFQLLVCAIAIGPGGVAEADGEVGDYSTGLRNALMAHGGAAETHAAADESAAHPASVPATATPIASSRRTSLATGEL